MTMAISLGHQLVADLKAGNASRESIDDVLGRLVEHARLDEGTADCEAVQLILEVLAIAPMMRVGIRTFLFNDHDVEDALQEALIAVSNSLPEFQARSSVLTWATAIARNKAKDILRRQGRPAAPDPVDGFTATGQRFTSNWATRADMEHALSGLSSKLRQVFVLVDVEGRSYDDVAVMLELPRNTVASRVRRARTQLAEQLVPEARGSRAG